MRPDIYIAACAISIDVSCVELEWFLGYSTFGSFRVMHGASDNFNKAYV